MITKFDRNNTSSNAELTRDLNAAFAVIAAKHNIDIKLGSGSFSAAQLQVKLVCRTKNTDIANEANQFSLMKLGLPTNAIGRTFLYKGQLYEIKAINRKKRRYPVETTKVSDGSILNFGASTVALLLPVAQGG